MIRVGGDVGTIDVLYCSRIPRTSIRVVGRIEKGSGNAIDMAPTGISLESIQVGIGTLILKRIVP